MNLKREIDSGDNCTQLWAPHPPLALGEVLLDLGANRLVDVLVQGGVPGDPSEHNRTNRTQNTEQLKPTSKSHARAWCVLVFA